MWILDAEVFSFQSKVSTLIQGVKDMGLLIGVYGQTDQISSLSKTNQSESLLIDSYFHDGVLSFLDHPARNLY